MKIWKVKVFSLCGFYEVCTLLAVQYPNKQGKSAVLLHKKRDLEQKKAIELVKQIRAKGQIDPKHWQVVLRINWKQIIDHELL